MGGLKDLNKCRVTRLCEFHLKIYEDHIHQVAEWKYEQHCDFTIILQISNTDDVCI